MVSARNVTIGLGVLIAIGLAVGIFNTTLEPSARRLAPDSYSGGWRGHRALVETLEALHVPVQRHESPAAELFEGDRRILLIEPDLSRLEREHGYLARLGEWVREGGQLVVASHTFVAPPSDDEEDGESESGDSEESPDDGFPRMTLFDALGLQPIETIQPLVDEAVPQPLFGPVLLRDAVIADDFVVASLSGAGALSGIAEDAPNVALLPKRFAYFPDSGLEGVQGVLHVVMPPASGQSASVIGVPRAVALQLRAGQGAVTLLSTPEVLNNLGMSVEDNSVIAYALAVGTGERTVVVDEFYHGRLHEGNWMAVAGRYPYNAIFLCVLFAASMRIWRSATRLGPPSDPPPPSRKSIVEYIDAMASLFARAKKYHYALRTSRDGLVEDIRESLRLPTGTPVPVTMKRYSLTQPADAERLERVFADIDATLSADGRLRKQDLTTYQESLDRCRPTMNMPRRRAK